MTVGPLVVLTDVEQHGPCLTGSRPRTVTLGTGGVKVLTASPPRLLEGSRRRPRRRSRPGGRPPDRSRATAATRRRSTTGSPRRSRRRRARSGRAHRGDRAVARAGIRIAPGTTPTSSSPGPRMSTICRSGSSSRHASRSAALSAVGPVSEVGMLGQDSFDVDDRALGRGRSRCGPGGPWPRCRARRRSARRPAGPGRTTSPAYSAKRPSRPTLTEPARWPEANASGERASIRTAPSRAAALEIGRASRRAGGSLSSSRSRSAPVRVGGEGEVERRHRLALGDGLDEVVLAHRAAGRSWCDAARRWSSDTASDIDLPQADPAPWAGIDEGRRRAG